MRKPRNWSQNIRSGRCLRRPSVSKADGPLATIVSPGATRRRELARRIVRSRDPHRVRVFAEAISPLSDSFPRPTRKFRTWNTFREPPGAIPLHPGRAHGRACQSPAAESGRRRTGLDGPGLAAVEAALRPHHRDQSGQGRNRLADRARRNAGQRPQSSRRSKA